MTKYKLSSDRIASQFQHSEEHVNQNETEYDKNVSGVQIDFIKLHDEVLQSGFPNFEVVQTQIPSNINIALFERELIGYYDQQVVKFLRYGFPVGHDGSDYSSTPVKNHKGSRDFPKQIDRYIAKEKSFSAIIGPLQSNPFQVPLSLSPLNTVEKKDSVDRRVILDLIHPVGSSVNEGIPSQGHLGENHVIRYGSVDDLVSLVKVKGKGCLLFKRELKQAYRQIPVDPGDLHLLGWSWNDSIYIDRVLPMGLRSSALMCQRLTDAIAYIMKSRGFSVVNYLDDFGGCESLSRAWLAYEELKTLLNQAGLVESQEKACPPDTNMVFLGILLNTVDLTLQVPKDKLEETKTLALSWKEKMIMTRKELESLIGKLNFLAICVRPGRVFISCLLNVLRRLPKTGSTQISQELLKDVEWWNVYLPHFNGISMMQMEEWSAPDQIIACDACLEGCGGITESGEFFHSICPKLVTSQELHINALELLNCS